MKYRTVFAPVAFEDTAQSVSASALRLAADVSGHVLGQHIRPRYDYYPPVSFYSMAIDSAARADEARAEAAAAYARAVRGLFEQACDAAGAKIVPVSEAPAQNGLTASWSDATDVLPTAYSRAARVADVSVVARPGEINTRLETDLFETLLMHSAAPVLVVPPDTGLEALRTRALVAWDGSLAASRAVRGAMPFLLQAEEVVLLTVGEADSGTPDAERAHNWLERGGVTARVKTIDWPRGPVAERILNQADANGCDLVVMGGYSHSRMQENLLGGVTRHMLAHADRPVLMAH